MALKLDVPWRPEPLQVGYETVTEELKSSGSPHIRQSDDGVDVIVTDFFGVNNEVSDVSRYRIGDGRKPIRHFDIPTSRLKIQQKPGSIVLLLESPSVEEYQFGNVDFPIAPASGDTGKRIDRCLGTVLSRVERATVILGFHVIISNPIQFQTNLRTIHGKSTWNRGKWGTLRNKVWKALWNEGADGSEYIQLGFRARLSLYKPSLVINACTGNMDCSHDDPKGLVDRFLQTELPNVPRYKACHPSHWSWSNCDVCSMGLERISSQPSPNAGNPAQ